ncbi:hypothetical protein [Limosilactobacillus coleohominis]|uniref:hypothetical protein n=1 Tax=Limosilactobacillus coleohominis TaxID=181675 RepID=UPI0026E937B9|nr:hypothetical protein [Limosilactobacillus coleohominis]
MKALNNLIYLTLGICFAVSYLKGAMVIFAWLWLILGTIGAIAFANWTSED